MTTLTETMTASHPGPNYLAPVSAAWRAHADVANVTHLMLVAGISATLTDGRTVEIIRSLNPDKFTARLTVPDEYPVSAMFDTLNAAVDWCEARFPTATITQAWEPALIVVDQ